MKPFVIYSASAGSGKTYTLALEYLTIALRHPENFKRILGVTFTNKATREMKTRILDFLKRIASGSDKDLIQELGARLEMTDVKLSDQAQKVLGRVLHQYSRFAVVTIDSFFHQVIRSFAREIGLQGSFGIDLDIDKVLQEVIDDMLSKVAEPEMKQLRIWLTQFAESRVEEGKPWDFRTDVMKLAKEIIGDEFKPYADQILALDESPGYFTKLKSELAAERKKFENQCRKLAKATLDNLSPYSIDDLSGAAGGPAKWLPVLAEDQDKKEKYDLKKTALAATEDLSKWIVKARQGEFGLVETVQDKAMPIYRELIGFIETKSRHYFSVVEMDRYLFTLGILSFINRELQAYRDDHDIMLISDLPDFLNRIIGESDTPYIYEKVGSTFSHYLIDEFQDTSVYQWNNFKPLVKNGVDEGKFSMVVGDVKQSIYRWRGGDWSLLQHKAAVDIGWAADPKTLDTNYRSAQTIVNFNNTFFQNLKDATTSFIGNMDEFAEGLLQQVLDAYKNVSQKSTKSETGEVQISFVEDSDEAGWKEHSIRNTIHLVERMQQDGYLLRDIAILTRSQAEGKAIANAFLEYKMSEAKPNLSYDVVSSEALFLHSSHVVAFIISLLKWIQNENDKIVQAEWLYKYHQLKGKDNPQFGDYKHWKKWVPDAFPDQVEHLKTLPLFELIETIIRLFQLHKFDKDYTYLQGFQDAVLEYSKNERGDIASFLAWWENVRKEKAILVADDNNAVKILTIHKAKGLEFPIVILPFLSWQTDNTAYNNEEIMWCSTEGMPLAQGLPVIPLRYSSSLQKTIWSSKYWEERIQNFMDALNLLYVAFTRPTHGLYAFCEKPGPRAKHIGAFVNAVIDASTEWDGSTFKVGMLPMKERRDTKQSAKEYGLQYYESQPWRDKISLKLSGVQQLAEHVADAQQWGIQLHQNLSLIETIEDMYRLEDEALKRELKLIVQHEDVEPFFTDLNEVRLEKPILLPGGNLKRIDRLVKKGDQWLVADFKTGKQTVKDHKQVEEYVDILSHMGYENVSGYLIYVDPINVIQVV
ncbi:MAG: UvrD-helicase domain-containing protein [Cyclobacteriaceae bacterium]